MRNGKPRARGFRRFYGKYAFTLWVLVAVAASMNAPGAFRSWFGMDLKVLIVPLIQVITFGMGTTLSAKDFRNVLTMPWPVFIGIALQFIIMPLVGFTIAMLEFAKLVKQQQKPGPPANPSRPTGKSE